MRSSYLASVLLLGTIALSFFLLGARAECENDCYDQGICVDDVCLCYPGYSGVSCETVDGNYTMEGFEKVTGNDSVAASPVSAPASTTPACTQFKCPSGACVAQPSECNTCSATQVYCSRTGTCARSVDKCPVITCPESTPYFCIGKGCKAKATDCLDASESAVSCAGDLVRCWDSSCEISQDMCPPVTGCGGTYSLRCADGSCTDDLSKCDNTLVASSCPSGQERCVTGQCRTTGTCPSYDGCPAATPYECDDKSCKATLAECTAGCATGLKKCLDGQCRVSCSADNRAVLNKPIPVSFKPTVSGLLSLAAAGGSSLGQIEKPADLTLSNDLSIGAAPDSELRDVYSEDLGGSAFGRVKSPAVKVLTGTSSSLPKPITYKLKCSDEDRLAHMCLGYIDKSGSTNTWKCADTSIERSGDQCVGTSQRTGVHALIASPEEDYKKQCTSGPTEAEKSSCRTCCQTKCVKSLRYIKQNTVHTFCSSSCRQVCNELA